ncbi:hypothetical protein EJ08DRAFT_696852 [Tothia fuscella]|uniref:Uncharacterized protein n=1 Tax=Tothia fuscella TaxID=1048955 RepID=A0A9P4NSK9_9PEZI|nr:hypothetical protein EJ08DRAFT_696852 [Tothia fuscella]
MDNQSYDVYQSALQSALNRFTALLRAEQEERENVQRTLEEERAINNAFLDHTIHETELIQQEVIEQEERLALAARMLREQDRQINELEGRLAVSQPRANTTQPDPTFVRRRAFTPRERTILQEIFLLPSPANTDESDDEDEVEDYELMSDVEAQSEEDEDYYDTSNQFSHSNQYEHGYRTHNYSPQSEDDLINARGPNRNVPHHQNATNSPPLLSSKSSSWETDFTPAIPVPETPSGTVMRWSGSNWIWNGLHWVQIAGSAGDGARSMTHTPDISEFDLDDGYMSRRSS